MISALGKGLAIAAKHPREQHPRPGAPAPGAGRDPALLLHCRWALGLLTGLWALAEARQLAWGTPNESVPAQPELVTAFSVPFPPGAEVWGRSPRQAGQPRVSNTAKPLAATDGLESY